MKKVLIIGATSAIATACARLWANERSEFFLVARNTEKLEQTAADLQARGASTIYRHRMDATDLGAHETMLDNCVSALGQIDIALVAHGTVPDQKSCEQDVALALREFANNGTSVIALLTRLANQLEAQGCGTLAVFSSVAGDRGRPSDYLYGTAKAAVSTFCEGLRARLSKAGVHVITIKQGNMSLTANQGSAPPATRVAKRIVAGIARQAPTLYACGFGGVVMMLIRALPHPVFNRLHL